MGILDGKRLLITGVLTDASLAFGVAQKALDEGADIVLTGAGRGLSLTTRISRKLKRPDGRAGDDAGIEVLELDVTVDDHMTKVVEVLDQKWGGLMGRCTPSVLLLRTVLVTISALRRGRKFPWRCRFLRTH